MSLPRRDYSLAGNMNTYEMGMLMPSQGNHGVLREEFSSVKQSQENGGIFLCAGAQYPVQSACSTRVRLPLGPLVGLVSSDHVQALPIAL